MKKINYLFVLLISLFGITSLVNAEASKYEPNAYMNSDITENEITMVLNFSGEDIMAVSQTLSYDSNYLELVDVSSIEEFNITISKEITDGKWRTVNILADSDYAFTETNYAVVTFKIKDKFKVGKDSKVYLYNYSAAGTEKYQYRDTGIIVDIQRESTSEVLYTVKDITKNTKIGFWIKDHFYIFIIIFVVLVGLIVFIILVPSKRIKENRQNKVKEQIETTQTSQNLAPIKVNFDEISAIGKEEVKIDETKAIEVNEASPFKGTTGDAKFDETIVKSAEASNINTNINAFNMTLPTENQVSAPAPVQQQAMPQTTVTPVVNAQVPEPTSTPDELDVLSDQELKTQNNQVEDLAHFEPMFTGDTNEKN